MNHDRRLAEAALDYVIFEHIGDADALMLDFARCGSAYGTATVTRFRYPANRSVAATSARLFGGSKAL